MKNSLSPALFTLEFSNLPQHINKETMITELWSHLEKNLNSCKKYNQKFNIIDIQLETKNYVIELEDDKGTLVKKVLFIQIIKNFTN